MKLRNKKTGEIVEVLFGNYKNPLKSVVVDNDNEPGEPYGIYNSLAELNKDWEDYREEPHIIDMGEEDCISSAKFGVELEEIERAKECGLYFETREEAEKTIEKLKAWKRLKDKGFRFIDHFDRDSGQCMCRYEWNGYINGEDLDLLFGGEE